MVGVDLASCHGASLAGWAQAGQRRRRHTRLEPFTAASQRCGSLGRIMNHKLLAARAPLAWIALGFAVAVALASTWVLNAGTGFDAVALVAGLSGRLDAVLLVLLLVVSCLFRPVPRGTTALVISTAVLAILLTVAAVLALVEGLNGAAPSYSASETVSLALGNIGQILMLTIVAWVVVACHWPSHAGETSARRDPDSARLVQDAPPVGAETETEQGDEDSPPPMPTTDDHAPTWELDKASGVVWQSAAAAATGQQGSGYGLPGQARGSWQAVPALQSALSTENDQTSSTEPEPEPADADATGQDAQAPAEWPVEGQAEQSVAGRADTRQAGRRFATAVGEAHAPASPEPPSRD